VGELLDRCDTAEALSRSEPIPQAEVIRRLIAGGLPAPDDLER
jgi:hypothetical protein